MRLSAQLGIPHLVEWPLGALSDKTEKDPKGHESTKDSGPFSFQKNNRGDSRRDEVRTMTVLFSELLVPGWAEGGTKIGLNAVTGAYGSEIAFALPCHSADPDMFFSDEAPEIELAKSLCGECLVRSQCLDAALSRQEPCGVWGGELFEDGSVVVRKRSVGRPRISREVAAEILPEAAPERLSEILPVSSVGSDDSKAEERSNAA
jgi:WhiB family redox-sensing transcriptional regulator